MPETVNAGGAGPARRRFLPLPHSMPLWKALETWAEPGLDLPLGLLRAVMGLMVILGYSQYIAEYDRFFARLGYCPRVEWHRVMPEHSLSYFQYVLNDGTCKLIAFAAVIPMVLFMLGIFPRVCAALSWYALVSMHDRCPLLLDGSDIVMRLILFLFIFARSDRRLSPVAPLVTAERADSFPIRLMQIQIALIYVSTGFQKIYGTKWLNGTALAYTLELQSFSRSDWLWLAQWPLVMNLMTWGTLVFELSFCFLVFFKPTRPFAILGGVALHLGIEVLMYVPMFSWVMMTSYLAFVEPAWAEAAVAWLTGPLARRSRARGVRVRIAGRGKDAERMTAALKRLDVFQALQWAEPEPVTPEDGDKPKAAKGAARLEVLGDGGKAASGGSAWLRVGQVVPSFWPALPLLVTPPAWGWVERKLGAYVPEA